MDCVSGGLRTKGIIKQNLENLVSIVTVVYNAQDLLEKTILSVLEQDYENMEYIIIDGGSNDKTLEIIEKYSDRIDYYISEKDKGIKYAKGRWINFMNAGDIFKHKSVLSDIFSEKIDPKSAVICGCYEFDTIKGVFFPERQLELVKYGNLLTLHQSMFFNAEILKEDIFYDVNFKISADNDMMMRLVKHKYLVHFSAVVVCVFDMTGISSRAHNRLEKYQIIYKNFGILGVFKALLFNRICMVGVK
ncbi:glycosyltransferase family 2 protein [Helicobacter cetorum]|uniref:Glycosyl transferase family protein n=1 Tax=Helicobacter cetorum (strain ATCC BAA-429 / MIT 00-7128) TaxID=182217 RepID=I0ELW7_HELC0|nr:glycosyltransferase family 2 protein [Helicobacter cetorum]AFI03936.1 glycosyl transferase family protein [Helicobacter cetorum MIT 00-7128]